MFQLISQVYFIIRHILLSSITHHPPSSSQDGIIKPPSKVCAAPPSNFDSPCHQPQGMSRVHPIPGQLMMHWTSLMVPPVLMVPNSHIIPMVPRCLAELRSESSLFGACLSLWPPCVWSLQKKEIKTILRQVNKSHKQSPTTLANLRLKDISKSNYTKSITISGPDLPLKSTPKKCTKKNNIETNPQWFVTQKLPRDQSHDAFCDAAPNRSSPGGDNGSGRAVPICPMGQHRMSTIVYQLAYPTASCKQIQ